jgi:hypothetical protein
MMLCISSIVGAKASKKFDLYATFLGKHLMLTIIKALQSK